MLLARVVALLDPLEKSLEVESIMSLGSKNLSFGENIGCRPGWKKVGLFVLA